MSFEKSDDNQEAEQDPEVFEEEQRLDDLAGEIGEEFEEIDPSDLLPDQLKRIAGGIEMISGVMGILRGGYDVVDAHRWQANYLLREAAEKRFPNLVELRASDDMKEGIARGGLKIASYGFEKFRGGAIKLFGKEKPSSQDRGAKA